MSQPPVITIVIDVTDIVTSHTYPARITGGIEKKIKSIKSMYQCIGKDYTLKFVLISRCLEPNISEDSEDIIRLLDGIPISVILTPEESLYFHAADRLEKIVESTTLSRGTSVILYVDGDNKTEVLLFMTQMYAMQFRILSLIERDTAAEKALIQLKRKMDDLHKKYMPIISWIDFE